MGDLNPDVILGMAAQAPDGMVIIDGEGLIRYWNRGAERIFGFTAAEVDGRSLDVIIPEKHRKRHWDGFQVAMAEGVTKYGDNDLLNVPALTASGGTISIEFSVMLLDGPEGGPGYVAAVIRDVTARRAQERETRKRLMEAAQDRAAS